jgi:hypothetical protein
MISATAASDVVSNRSSIQLGVLRIQSNPANPAARTDQGMRDGGDARVRRRQGDFAEPVVGRRFAPTRWLNPGYF